ncbi:MAG: hypoxanthine phosphoribosyltransferase [Deltaproteobacteria bacterium]|nr:hypoxanthine phosphoribosyltransferase [Deltaproteobacteria bacterium]
MKKIILTRQQIQKKVEELGRRISEDFRDEELLLVGVLNGAFIFLADLAREIALDLRIDFIRVASYGAGSSSAGTVTFTKDVELPVRGKKILLVEDIIDTGRTIARLKQHFLGQGAVSVQVCALIDKKERREVEVQADYTGFDVAEGFLVGYGLDFAEQHRCLPDIYHLENPTAP